MKTLVTSTIALSGFMLCACGAVLDEAKLRRIVQQQVRREISRGLVQYGKKSCDASRRSHRPRAMGNTTANPGGSKWDKQVSESIRKVGVNAYEIDRRIVYKLFGDTTVIGGDGKLYPHVKNGKPDGFRFGRVRPKGIFAALGFRGGDVIHRVDKTAVTSERKIWTVITKLFGFRVIEVAITRYGRPRVLKYQIVR